MSEYKSLNNKKQSFKFKNLREENIISAVVHLDEGTPHMHIVFVLVVHTKDKESNDMDKVCNRDFWKGRDSYRILQNNFYDYITSKGFELEREIEVEETGARHEKIEELKKITNFENTKKVLDNIKLELPEIPDINDIKIIKLNREKVENDIIKSKDKLINELYQDNKILHKELSKQVNLVDKAAKYEKENSHLQKVVDKFYETVEKFSIGESKELIRNFEKETNTLIDPEKQIKKEEREKNGI